MKKVYIIYSTNIEFVFTSKAKALKQMQVIKEMILSGTWFIDQKKYTFCDTLTINEKDFLRYAFVNSDTGKILSYFMVTKDLNSGYNIK